MGESYSNHLIRPVGPLYWQYQAHKDLRSTVRVVASAKNFVNAVSINGGVHILFLFPHAICNAVEGTSTPRAMALHNVSFVRFQQNFLERKEANASGNEFRKSCASP